MIPTINIKNASRYRLMSDVMDQPLEPSLLLKPRHRSLATRNDGNICDCITFLCSFAFALKLYSGKKKSVFFWHVDFMLTTHTFFLDTLTSSILTSFAWSTVLPISSRETWPTRWALLSLRTRGASPARLSRWSRHCSYWYWRLYGDLVQDGIVTRQVACKRWRRQERAATNVFMNKS